MKQLVLVVMMLFIGMTINAQVVQDSTAIKISEAERLIDKYGGSAIKKFDETVEKITPFAEQGFEIATKLQFAKGIAYLLVIPFMFIFWILFHIYYHKSLKGGNKDWTDNDYGAFALCFLVLSLCTTIGAIPALYHGLIHVIAPEWFAIKEILNLF